MKEERIKEQADDGIIKKDDVYKSGKYGIISLEVRRMAIVLEMKDIEIGRNFINNYLEQFESNNTRRNYEYAIKEFFKVEDVNDISLKMIENVGLANIEWYVRMLKGRKLSSGTIRNRINALRSLFSYLEDLTEDGIENVFDKKSIKRLLKVSLDKEDYEFHGKILGRDEIEEMLKKAKDNQRDYLLLKMMFNTGTRRDEIGNIKWNDFMKIDGEWYLNVKGKGRKQRLIWINEDLVELLKGWEYGFKLGESEWKVFGISGNRVNEIVKKYGDVNAHSLRKTAITMAIDNGASRESVQDYAGHSKWETTERYFQFVGRMKMNAARKIRV